MAKYTILSQPGQAEDPKPYLVVEADDLDAVPSRVQPFDRDDDDQVYAAAMLAARINEDPSDIALVLGRIAVSYGGIVEGDYVAS